MRAIRCSPLDFLRGLFEQYGDMSFHRAGGEPVFVVSSPELARTVLRDRYTSYLKSGTPDDQMLRPLLGNGLLTSEGEVWARQRRLCAPAFRPATIEQFAPRMTDAAYALARRWERAGRDGTPLRVDHDLMALTLGIVAQAMLGTDLTGMGPGFGQAVDAVNRYLGHYVPGEEPDSDFYRRQVEFDRGRRFLEMLVRTLISARRLGVGAEPDLLASLLGAPEDDGALDDTELRDQVLTMVMAGHETTAKALTWTLHLLDGSPQELAAVREEVDRVLCGRPAAAQDVAHLVRVRAVIQESMRLFPPVWLLSRRCAVDDVVGGFDVPAGSLVCVSPWVLHRRADVWERPADFLPDRFLPGAQVYADSHAYLPFGGGPRTCIGQHFALLEAVLVLATLLQTLDLRQVPGQSVVPEALVTLRPRDGLLMTARPRARAVA